MNNKYLIFLLGFEVSMVDRRTREQASGFIVVPSPGRISGRTERRI